MPSTGGRVLVTDGSERSRLARELFGDQYPVIELIGEQGDEFPYLSDLVDPESLPTPMNLGI